MKGSEAIVKTILPKLAAYISHKHARHRLQRCRVAQLCECESCVLFDQSSGTSACVLGPRIWTVERSDTWTTKE